MTRKLKLLPSAAALAIALSSTIALVPATAEAAATTFTSTFTQSNTTPSATVQNWGTLNLSCTGTTCSVSLTPIGDIFFGNHFLGFNLNSGATNITLSSAMTTAGGTLATGQNTNFDGFGNFANVISLPDGPNSGFSSLVSLFTVNFTGDANTLLALNSSNFDASGHVFFNAGQCTGYVGEGTGTNNGSPGNCESTPPPPVPEPGALLLIGTGLIGLATIQRRRRFQS